MKHLGFLLTAIVVSISPYPVRADDTPEAKPAAEKTAAPDRDTLIKQFEKSMSGATLVGFFTVDGQEAKNGLKEEKYHLKSVKKLKHGDFWQFEYAYGPGGKTISLPLEVKWAGDTPVITLTDVLVPGVGTFTARVLFYRNEYAGTWSASDHGGRLFGKVVPAGGDDTGWIPLFDGKSLAGWHKNPDKIGHGTGGSWTVEDGVLIGQQDPPGSGNGGVLLTDRKFGDFELSIDMKPDWGVDSGVFLRSNDKGQCFQMMVDYHEAGDVGHIYGEGTGGFNNRPFGLVGVYDDQHKLVRISTGPVEDATPEGYSATGEEWLKAWKVGDWNTARVTCVGQPPKITTWLNGVKISEFDGQAFAGKNYDKQKVADQLGAEGSIAVQVHGGKGWPAGAACRWRNIKIRPLSR
ncbi:MAG TPA: DUF1080 domain-containing protein [Pirellulales bacterium]|nr:DUF1080 domain-containing protein [Pirellulales bacterium]